MTKAVSGRHFRKALVAIAAQTVLAGCGQGEPDTNAATLARDLRAECAFLAERVIDGEARITESRLLAASPSTPEFCKATADFETSALRFSVWLPIEHWNGKLAFIGGGGFDGVLMREDFRFVFSPSVLEDGYAIVATNGGYDAPATSNPLDYFNAEFAFDAEKRADFMYRSEHRTLPFAESLIEGYYDAAVTHRYFEGCSMGGHDAMLLSQRYPDDFDGIVARAPAGNIVGLMRQFHRIGARLRNQEIEFSPQERELVADAVLARCDALDGLEDGIIANTQACDFDPASLLCESDEDETCLPEPKITFLETVTTPLEDGSGKVVHPGYGFGGEDQAKGWGEYIWPNASGYSVQMLFVQGFVRAFVTADREFDAWSWQPEEWHARLDEIRARFNAFDPDLSRFHESGGKLILWNGTLDTSVSPKDTVRYYEAVLETMGQERADETVELFLAPGAAHCEGGVGPDQVDLMNALAAWVEEGTPPSRQHLVLTRAGGADGMPISRPMCTYPQYPHYRGAGNPADAQSFACRTAPQSTRPGAQDQYPKRQAE